jgi:uncharacterized protein YndB with AHSA1/START domain
MSVSGPTSPGTDGGADGAGGADVPRPPSQLAVAVGVGVSVLLFLYSCGAAFTKAYGTSFFAIPYFIGFIVALLTPERPYRKTLNASLAVLGLGLLVLLVVKREGLACVLFAAPLLIALMLLGTLCGVPLRRFIDSRKKRVVTIVSLMLISASWQAVSGHFDDPLRHPQHRVTSEVAIAAAPERVFQVLAGDTTVTGTWPWMLKLGLPIPRRLVVDRPGPGGQLRIEFNHGTAHARITAWEPGRQLAFQVERYQLDDPPFFITRLGRGEHFGLKAERVTEWLSFEEIRYTFARTDDGGTRLTRTTSFRRHLSPDFYFGWLEQSVMQRGQERLLRHLRERIETPATRGVEVSSR